MLFDLSAYERQVYSQHGEDGCLEAIFEAVGTTNKVLVEISADDGVQCCSRNLRDNHGWTGLVVGRGEGLVDAWVTRENVASLLAEHDISKEPDLLILDIDGNDYHVLKAILDGGYAPRAMCLEYNPYLGDAACTTIAYNPDHKWDGSPYFGASLLALTRLVLARGYALLGCDSTGVNVFFLRADAAVKLAYRRFLGNPIVIESPPGEWDVVGSA